VQPGLVISGRIKELRDKEEAKLGVFLNCQKAKLESHE